MTALRTIAAASIVLLGLGAVANAQTTRQGTWVESHQPALESGRSAYVDRAPATDAATDQTVMGLRVPNGPRYR